MFYGIRNHPLTHPSPDRDEYDRDQHPRNMLDAIKSGHIILHHIPPAHILDDL